MESNLFLELLDFVSLGIAGEAASWSFDCKFGSDYQLVPLSKRCGDDKS
jgi:hypothetical protein